MRVTIADRRGAFGEGFKLVTVEIADTCPLCGAKRGVEMWKGRSYDGSRWSVVDCWNNECGHTDSYADVIKEAEARKEVSHD